jgi:pilus assembly protein Flp/PilA
MLERILAYFFVTAGDVRERVRRDDGATAVEYGLLVALIAAIIIVVLLVLGPQIADAFTRVGTGW